ncbi:HAD hydrolase-like protein [Candidatus Pacearchaeota archaeon]|nr:HAD hydrolase-like protein [Candidatus Pacearchaeota archaeon]
MSSFFRRLFSWRENPGVKLIVFDFDGTLADTRELLLRIVSKHLLSFEISLTKNMIKFFGSVPLWDYVSFVGVPSDFVRSLCSAITKDFMNEYHKIKPCKNLMTVKNIECKKIIVSNNSTDFVNKSLEFLHADSFDEVYGADKFKGHNKVWMINKLKKKYRLNADEIVYVGDKDIDVDVSRGVGCYSVVIASKSSWSSRTDIVKKKSDYVLTDLGKLAHVVAELNMEQLPAV